MNSRNTFIWLGVLIALGAFVWYQQANKPASEAPDTPDYSAAYVWQISSTEVMGFKVTDNLAHKTTALSRDANGNWSMTEPYAAEADSGQIDYAAANLAYLSVQRTLTETTDLEPFGLLNPAYTLEVALGDGTAKTLSIGQKAPSAESYYVLRPGESYALVVGAYGLRPLLDMVETPPVKPTETPTVEITGTPGG